MLITLDNKVAKYTFSIIGKMDDDVKLRNFGSLLLIQRYRRSIIGIEKYNWSISSEIDQDRNAITKIWKLEK